MKTGRFLLALAFVAGCSDDPMGPGGDIGSWTQIAVGAAHVCALAEAGSVYCWGDTESGQTGQSAGPVRRPSFVETSVTFSQIAAGGDTSCGISTDDTLYCWGSNALGQLGDGTGQSSSEPVAVSGGLSWESVSVGTYHVCGIDSESRTICWGGDRWDAALGYPAFSECTAPQFEPTWPCALEPVPDLHAGEFDWVEAGLYQTCAGSVGGAGVCWGTNDAGQLGTSTTQLCAGNDPQHPSDRPCSRAPVAPDGVMLGHIAPGTTHGCGLAGSDLYCWGGLILNIGQVGDGSLDGAAAPVQPASGGPWTAVYTSHEAHIRTFSCGIEQGGAALCWGANRFGQLGSGTAPECGPNSVPCRDEPTPVQGGYSFASLGLGVEFACGITTGGEEIVCWGQNSGGQLGDGTLEARDTPAPVVF